MVGMEGFDGVADTGTMEFMHAISYDRAFFPSPQPQPEPSPRQAFAL